MMKQETGGGIILFPPHSNNAKDFVSSCVMTLLASLIFVIFTGFLGGLVLWGATGFSASLSQILQIMFFYA